VQTNFPFFYLWGEKTLSNLDERNKGKRVRLVFTSDPYTQLKPGDLGTYQDCLIQPDGRHQHSIQWDSGSTLMLIEGVDKFEFVKRCRFCGNMQAYGTEGSMRCIKNIVKPNDEYAEQCQFFFFTEGSPGVSAGAIIVRTCS